MKLRNRVLLVAIVAAAAPAFAASIPVPNGNFTSTTNAGFVGNIIGSGTNVTIGTSGPWTGTYAGILGILPLLAPTLDIDAAAGGGTATISNIAGVDILGLDNSGSFQQDLGGSNLYLANTTYTLGATIDGDTALTVQALSGFGAGIALLNGGNVLSSSADPTQLLFVGLLSTGVTDQYRLTLSFTTGATAPTGDIGIRLFDDPNGLLTANVLPSVTFSNVTLDASSVTSSGPTATPEPSECFLTGFGMIGLASIWKRMQRKRAAAAAAIS